MTTLEEFENNLRFLVETARKPLVWLETFDYGYVIDTVGRILNNSDSVLIYNNARRYVHKHSSENKALTTKMPLGHFIPIFLTEECGDKDMSSSANIDDIIGKRILVAKVSESMFEKGGNNKIEEHLVERLQDFVYQNNKPENGNKRKTILLISATNFNINGLEHICERLSVPLPDKEDIHAELDIELGKNEDGTPIYKYPYAADFRKGKKTRDNKKDLIDALYGMTLYDIRELLRSLMAESNGKIRLDFNGMKLPARVIARKKQLVKNSGLLEVIDLKNKARYHEKVGGINGLRYYLKKQKKKISPLFLHSKLPKPKGVLLVGAPGCGKSESAKATASILELPLYRLNIGDLLGHKYGQSENRFNEALKTADASAPCVLWIDEIEKAFAGAGNEQNNDDTLTHIIGRFLTWMQEHETLVYLVATANDLSKMRPELLRKGRWDEIFYLSYPELSDIKEIISRKRKEYSIILIDDDGKIVEDKYYEGKLTESAIPDDIIEKMQGMSGAEIVSILVEAANEEFPYDAYDNGSDIEIPVAISKIREIVESSCKQKQTSDGKNSEILNLIEDDLLELKLKYIGNFDKNKEETARKLLEEKHMRKDDVRNYESKGYKSASKYVNS